MKFKITMFFLLLVGNYIFAIGDTLNISNKKVLLGIESGFTSHTTKAEYDFVRAQVLSSSGMDGESSGATSKLRSMYFQPYAALNLCYNINEQMSVSSGIKYATSFSVIGNKLFKNEKEDFFYIKTKSENQNTYYYRINNIRQRAHYIGVPVGFKYISPFYLESIRLYARADLDFLFKVNEISEVDFYNADSKPYEEDVLNLFSDLKNTHVALNFSFGYLLGKQGKTNVLAGMYLPSVILNGKGSGMVNPKAGIGAYLSLLVPIK